MLIVLACNIFPFRQYRVEALCSIFQRRGLGVSEDCVSGMQSWVRFLACGFIYAPGLWATALLYASRLPILDGGVAKVTTDLHRHEKSKQSRE